MKPQPTLCPPARRHRTLQHGAASLAVVMVLFFIISMVAAYAARNLVFEQRTSFNQYRSTLALETAEAGLEWAQAMLNQGRISDSCAASTSSGADLISNAALDQSFRSRYLNVSGSSGEVTAIADRSAVCLWNGSSWTCSCSTGSVATALPSLTVPTGAGIFPAFRIRFVDTDAPRTSRVMVESVACTKYETGVGAGSFGCLNFGGAIGSLSTGASSEGRAVVRAMLVLAGNTASPPRATLTALGDVETNGITMALYNTRTTASGITVQAGGEVDDVSDLELYGLPGSRRAQTVASEDTGLAALTAVTGWTRQDRFFASVFNLSPAQFLKQPAVNQLNCSSGCNAATVREALARRPGHPLWLNGDLVVDGSADIGSATNPALIIVNGNLSFTSSTGQVYGMVYLRKPAGGSPLSVSGSGRINGSLVADDDLALGGTAAPTVAYEPDILTALRFTTGSIVRAPGSWQDFQLLQ